MNTANESILMLIVVLYFLCLRALYAALQDSKVSKGLVLNFFMAFNVSSVIILAYKGLPLAIVGFRPSLLVMIITMTICSFLLLGRVGVTRMRFFDSFIVSCAMIGTASVLPIGLHQLLQEGIRMNLIWPWLVVTLALTLCSITTANVKKRRIKCGKQKKNSIKFSRDI